MTTLEDRVTKIESEIGHIQDDVKEVKREIKSINTVNNEFVVKLDRLSVALDNNVKSTEKLTDYMDKQLNKGNIAFGKIGWLILGAVISGAIGLAFKLLS